MYYLTSSLGTIYLNLYYYCITMNDESLGRCTIRKTSDTYYIHFEDRNDYVAYVKSSHNEQLSWLRRLFDRPRLDSLQHFQQNAIGMFIEVFMHDKYEEDYTLQEYWEDEDDDDSWAMAENARIEAEIAAERERDGQN